MQDVFAILNEIFQEVFDCDELRVTRETTSADVEGWDSLMHVTLILRIEKRLGIRFTSSEVASLKDVGELADLVAIRLGSR